MKRITIATLGLLVGTTGACRDLGLEGNAPLEEAEDRPPSALVAAVLAPVEAVSARLVVDGRLWIPSGMPLTLDEADVRAVGSASGRTVYARHWDESPYDALFLRQPSEGATAAGAGATTGRATIGAVTSGGDAWIELRPVRGRTGPVPGEPGATEGGAAAPDTPAAGGGLEGH